eukprot:6351976-Amphidinium_carterae.1
MAAGVSSNEWEQCVDVHHTLDCLAHPGGWLSSGHQRPSYCKGAERRTETCSVRVGREIPPGALCLLTSALYQVLAAIAREVFSSADFEIDPTVPEYRPSEGMRTVTISVVPFRPLMNQPRAGFLENLKKILSLCFEPVRRWTLFFQ